MTKYAKETCYNSNKEVVKMLGKIDELKRRTIDVLEKTKKEKTKYAEERKKIMDFYSKRKMIFITQVALTQDLRNCVRMQI